MCLRERVLGLNRYLTALYKQDMRVSLLLSDMGFSEQQIRILQERYLNEVVQRISQVINTQFHTIHSGERLLYVITKWYGLDGKRAQTLASLGEEYGISRERVRQLQNKALKRMRSPKQKLAFEQQLSELALSLLQEPDSRGR